MEFDIEPKTPDSTRPELGTDRRRQADVYVFALLKHKDKDTVDPLHTDQRDLYVLPTATLNEKEPGQKKIRLTPLIELKPERASYGGLVTAIDRAFPDPRASQAQSREEDTE